MSKRNHRTQPHNRRTRTNFTVIELLDENQQEQLLVVLRVWVSRNILGRHVNDRQSGRKVPPHNRLDN